MEIPRILQKYRIIRIPHECEGGIEKSVPRITDWHHKACRVMSNCDPEGQIFLSHPHMNNGFFFLLTTKYLILYWKNMKKASRKSFAEMQYGDVILSLKLMTNGDCEGRIF